MKQTLSTYYPYSTAHPVIAHSRVFPLILCTYTHMHAPESVPEWTLSNPEELSSFSFPPLGLCMFIALQKQASDTSTSRILLLHLTLPIDTSVNIQAKHQGMTAHIQTKLQAVLCAKNFKKKKTLLTYLRILQLNDFPTLPTCIFFKRVKENPPNPTTLPSQGAKEREISFFFPGNTCDQ